MKCTFLTKAIFAAFWTFSCSQPQIWGKPPISDVAYHVISQTPLFQGFFLVHSPEIEGTLTSHRFLTLGFCPTSAQAILSRTLLSIVHPGLLTALTTNDFRGCFEMDLFESVGREVSLKLTVEVVMKDV
jgi:hypothetical protein